jgi:hypothetical protein
MRGVAASPGPLVGSRLDDPRKVSYPRTGRLGSVCPCPCPCARAGGGRRRKEEEGGGRRRRGKAAGSYGRQRGHKFHG